MSMLLLWLPADDVAAVPGVRSRGRPAGGGGRFTLCCCLAADGLCRLGFGEVRRGLRLKVDATCVFFT